MRYGIFASWGMIMPQVYNGPLVPTYSRTGGMCLVFAYEYKFEFEKDSNIAKNKQLPMLSYTCY